MRRRFSAKNTCVLIVVVIIGALLFHHQQTSSAQGECQTFKETGKSLCGRFLEYWRQNGGLLQQGYPISNEFQEASDVDENIYTVQYFERAEFEKHPENQRPFDVLLTHLGSSRFREKYPVAVPTVTGAQAASPEEIVGKYFSAMTLDGGVSILVQYGLLSKRLAARLRSSGSDPYYGLVAKNFPAFKTIQNAPGTDQASSGPAWVLLLNEQGRTVGVFTLVMEDGAWKIDYVEPNALTP